jgi:preprotein translocase subunit SecG
MIFYLLLFLFLAVCALLCFLVLIQSDKGGGISGALGGLSGASSFLGTQDTANVLTKGTYIFGSAFLALCILMTFFIPGGGVTRSGLEERARNLPAVTSMPVSAGGGLGFVGEDAGAATETVVGGGGGGGPTIIGDIVEGGVVRRMGEDGMLIDVEPEPAEPADE